MSSKKSTVEMVQRINETFLILDMIVEDLDELSTMLRSLVEVKEETSDEDKFEAFGHLSFEEDVSNYDPIEELGDYDISKYLVGHEFQFY